LRSREDLKADDCGAWKNNGVRSVVISTGETVEVITREKKAKSHKMENGQYLLTRNYFLHRASDDFRKIIFTLTGKCVLHIMDESLMFKMPVNKGCVFHKCQKQEFKTLAACSYGNEANLMLCYLAYLSDWHVHGVIWNASKKTHGTMQVVFPF